MAPTPARAESGYRLRDTAALLAIAAATVLALDSQGLLTWARRLDVGPVQSRAVAVLEPWHQRLDQLGLTQPRRLFDAGQTAVRRWVGASEDPLLAGGWAAGSEPRAAAPSLREGDSAAAPDDLPSEELHLLGAPIFVPEESTAEPALPTDPATPGKSVTVLLVGDSMIAGSLGSALTRALQRDPRLNVVQAFQTATGLARPDVYDWMKVVPALLQRERPALIIASFGANDATNIWVGDNRVSYGDALWRRAYAERVTAMMRTLAGDRARVLWLGLPPMRDGRLAERVATLNDIDTRCARGVARLEFLQLDMLVSERPGEFSTFRRTAEGKYVRVRLDDGVHYAPAGAWAIARWALDWVRERLAGRAEP